MCRLIAGAPGSDSVTNMTAPELDMRVITHDGGERRSFERNVVKIVELMSTIKSRVQEEKAAFVGPSCDLRGSTTRLSRSKQWRQSRREELGMRVGYVGVDE
jgi:hypothetical protein